MFRFSLNVPEKELIMTSNRVNVGLSMGQEVIPGYVLSSLCINVVKHKVNV